MYVCMYVWEGPSYILGCSESNNTYQKMYKNKSYLKGYMIIENVIT